MVTQTNQPTNRLTDQQGKYSAICLFGGWNIEGRDLQHENIKTFHIVKATNADVQLLNNKGVMIKSKK